MTIMFLVHQVCELDKTTLGDVAIEKINNLTFDQVMEIIKSKDRSEFPVAWDLQDNLELQELKVCCVGVTTPYQNLCNAFEWADNAFLGKIIRAGDTYVTEKGYKFIRINDIERLYYKEEDENTIQVSKPSEPKSKYLKWEDLKKYNLEGRLKVKLNNVEYELHFEKWSKYDDATRISLYLNGFCVMSIRLKTNYDKQFFNDLHLEVIE